MLRIDLIASFIPLLERNKAAEFSAHCLSYARSDLDFSLGACCFALDMEAAKLSSSQYPDTGKDKKWPPHSP